MFGRILIANRGEIACRIIGTARRLGIATVAVYSAADAAARHVRLADEAVGIGPAPARESYLAIDKIVAAAQMSGAQAVHPGYGFLSENADFAEACAAAGLVFVGPPAAAIRAMGAKAAAKTLLAAAGVPLVPGYHGAEQDADFLQAQAEALGYPLLIKASAGGGGKGMRRVKRGADFAAALASCRREAAAAFGSEAVILEKYLAPARHVEIQVFADRHGHCVHLFERDCSLQRRHQKVLEEAPAPGMSAELRRRMGEAAVAAARAVGYVGAGTVEFLVDGDGGFYFMEMNTRLQVEHPVTEMISGQDLVEWQLRVAAGEPLPLSQEDLRIHGHALEARLYAEDAERGFLPASGRLLRLAPPAASRHVRVDSGVEEGDEITPHYDPMIAKLVVWDESRDAALARLRRALAEFRVAGVATNLAFLSRLAACPAVAAAEVDTGFIEREHDSLFPPAPPLPREALLLAAVGELLREEEAARRTAAASADPWSPWQAGDGWRLNLAAVRTLAFRDGERRLEVEVRYRREGTEPSWDLSAAGETTPARAWKLAGDDFAAELGDRRFVAGLAASGEQRHLFFAGATYLLHLDALLQPPAGGAESPLPGGIAAPMPGRIAALLATPGQRVDKGAPLLVLEAMKMEHTLAAPAAGTLVRYRFGVGEQVAEGAELLEFEAGPPEHG